MRRNKKGSGKGLRMKKSRIGRKWMVLALALALLLAGCGRGMEKLAAEYVQADLDLVFQGETQGAKKFIDASKTDLEQVYVNGINAFVQNYLMGGVETDTDFSTTYGKTVEQIFTVQKYQVGEAKRTGKHTYEVPVTYRPVNVFTIFIPELREEAAKIEADAAAGKYSGTEEEIQKAMILDYMTHAYTLLERAYMEMEHGEEETFTFTVTAENKKKISMDEAEINTFIERILELDKLENV